MVALRRSPQDQNCAYTNWRRAGCALLRACRLTARRVGRRRCTVSTMSKLTTAAILPQAQRNAVALNNMQMDQSQQLIPPEDLVVFARRLAPNYHELIERPEWTAGATDWRAWVAPSIRELWPRLNYQSRMVAFVVAASIAEKRKKR